jgi:hypothetical protein
MIIIAGIPSEEPVSFVIKSAENLGIDHFVFNQRKAFKYDICFSASNNLEEAFLYADGEKIDLLKIDGIYYRMMESAILPENRNRSTTSLDDEQKIKLNFINDLFTNICDILPCRIANRPKNMNSNFSKLYQGKFILNAGLRFPETIITNVPEKVRNMKKEQGELIFKSISSTRSIVKKLDFLSEPRLKYLKFLPTQFQECLKGNNIRVHVVGDKIFAAEISTESIDYRYAASDNNEIQMVRVNLPEKIKSKCFQLSEALSLPLCGIDIFRTFKNEFYCFEANPCPGYSYYQNLAGLKISDAIVKYLAYGTATNGRTRRSAGN